MPQVINPKRNLIPLLRHARPHAHDASIQHRHIQPLLLRAKLPHRLLDTLKRPQINPQIPHRGILIPNRCPHGGHHLGAAVLSWEIGNVHARGAVPRKLGCDGPAEVAGAAGDEDDLARLRGDVAGCVEGDAGLVARGEERDARRGDEGLEVDHFAGFG